MFEASFIRRIIIRSINICLLLSVSLWALLLVRAALQILKTEQDQYTVSIGHLVLAVVSQHPIGQGRQIVHFSLGSDIVWYGLIWLAVGAAMSSGFLIYARHVQCKVDK